MHSILEWFVVCVWLSLPYYADGFGQWHHHHHRHPPCNFGGGGLISRRRALPRPAAASTDNNEKDLWDYFDPLQSPHSYPKGIDAAAVQAAVVAATTDSEPTKREPATDVHEKDTGFDTDPLGWGLSSPPGGRRTSTTASSTPRKKRTLKVIGLDMPDDESVAAASSLPTRHDANHETIKPAAAVVVDVASVFDPTLSPHYYTKGAVPAVIVGDELPSPPPPSSSSQNDDAETGTIATRAVKTVGILLIDHGSRNAASNERLQALANLYQEQNGPTKAHAQRAVQVVVQAAHMEIASPSIADGLATLMEQHNVDEIVCHPFFLSPGRHVTEDIPSLVAAAVHELGIAVPVHISPPVGSRTQLMMEAIHSLVRETSELLESD
jgi:CbiX